MGWMSWQRYRCNIDCKNQPRECISEDLYKRMADRIVSDGYRELGYEYVNIDDCWTLKNRSADGKLVADPGRFPSGIAALAKYMHDRGLKLGIYGDAGTHTCGGYPGSEGFFDVDAQTFADWGVDSLKLDGCYLDVNDMTNVYPLMTAALNKTGRPILYSCSWPAYQTNPDYPKIANYCNIWRNYGDIGDSWTSVKNIADWFVQNQNTLVPIAKPGAFNDPDMIIVGNFGLTKDQAKVQMAIWSILASPILMSNDLDHITPEFRHILQNRHVIAVNQDKDGKMGEMTKKDGNIHIFRRPVRPEGSVAIALVNRVEGGGPAVYKASARDMGLTDTKGYYVTDLFDNNRLVTILGVNDTLTVTVNPMGVVFYKATLIGSK